jgi:hypothetical protein
MQQQRQPQLQQVQAIVAGDADADAADQVEHVDVVFMGLRVAVWICVGAVVSTAAAAATERQQQPETATVSAAAAVSGSIGYFSQPGVACCVFMWRGGAGGCGERVCSAVTAHSVVSYYRAVCGSCVCSSDVLQTRDSSSNNIGNKQQRD